MSKPPVKERPGVVSATPAALAPTSQRYDAAFKRQAVEHWLRSDRPGTQLARDLGVSYPTLKAELARVREQPDLGERPHLRADGGGLALVPPQA